MIKKKLKEIRDFCEKNATQAVVEKYSRYFKEGYDGYGVEQEVFESQRDAWLKEWDQEMTLKDYLILGDALVENGKFEEAAFAIHFVAAYKNQYDAETFDGLGKWLENGICNWASTDVLCLLTLSHFVTKEIIELEAFSDWTQSPSKWKRRAVPVSLIYAIRKGVEPERIFSIIEPLMLDASEDVQKGLGTLLRETWKKHPERAEDFLLKWKDRCARIIIQYATEKMDKEQRKRFKKA